MRLQDLSRRYRVAQRDHARDLRSALKHDHAKASWRTIDDDLGFLTTGADRRQLDRLEQRRPGERVLTLEEAQQIEHDAALDDERRANASLRADVAHLEAALAAARRASSAHEAESKRLAGALERCEAKAAAYEASRAGVESAEAATARLAEAREALEAKTAELTRLRAVLRGKLLARVTEEADAARANAERLGRAEVWAK